MVASSRVSTTADRTREPLPDFDNDSEQELLERARRASSYVAFIVGAAAAAWCQRYARGRTDADLAHLLGLNRSTVTNRRQVHERFCQTFDNYGRLKWSHFFVALNWPDAETCLAWAHDNKATVDEMKAWRRMQHGEDLTVDSEAEIEPEPEFARETVAALPAMSAVEHDPAELTEPSTIERAREPAAAYSETLDPPAAESLGDPAREDRRRLHQILKSMTRAFRGAQQLGEWAEPVVVEHVDRLLDELRRGDELGGLDGPTVEGMLRTAVSA